MSDTQNSGVELEAAAPAQTVNETSHAEAGLRAALQAERAQRQAEQEKARLMEEHIALLQANQRAQVNEPLADLSDSDVITKADAKRLVTQHQQEMAQALQQLQIVQKYPDYYEVVGKHLPEVVKQNPYLEQSLRERQDYALAYHLAKTSDSYRESQKQAKRSQEAERILQNANQSGSLASTGQATPVTMAKNYKAMTDAEFLAAVQKNMGAPF